MGTKGCVVFRYRGVYYIFYNSHDSYFSCLGKVITDNVNEMLCNRGKWEWLKVQLMRIPFHFEGYTEGEATYHGIYDNVRNPECFSYMTSNNEQQCQIFTEYVYTLDLDNKEFIVNKYGDRVVFKLKFGRPLPDLEQWWDNKRDNEEDADKEDNDDDGVSSVNSDDSNDTIKLKMQILEAQIKMAKLALSIKSRAS